MGNEMGAGKLKRAERYAKNFLILQFIVTILGALFCVAIRWQIIGVYNITPEIAESVSRCIIVFALFMPFKMFNYVMVVGILRSGGDTKMCLLLDCSGVWMIGVPMAFLGACSLGSPFTSSTLWSCWRRSIRLFSATGDTGRRSGCAIWPQSCRLADSPV